MIIFNVSNAVELKSAISSAVGGDRIVLADGEYGAVSVFNRAYSSTVTFEAAGTGAHLDGLFVAGSKNLNFVGLDVGRALKAGEPTYTQLSYIKSSTNVTVDGVHFHGSIDGNPSNDGVGLTVNTVTGLTVVNSRFEDLYRGMVVQNTTNTTIQDNEITTIRSDGIISIANDDLTIQGNHIGEFKPALGDHADAIQFWNTGQTRGQSNITIKDNEIYQSVSGIGIQGIFMSDPLAYGYKNVVIENNLLYSNDQYNGIFINGADGVQIHGNTVTSKSSDGKNFWIRLQDSSQVTLTDNVTDRIMTSNLKDFVQSGNLDFGADATLRSLLPNLANPTCLEDLVIDKAGYQLPSAAKLPPAPEPLQVTFTGSDGDNSITANAADNVIDGGKGADTMYGLGGNDRYIVDHAGDRAVEDAGAGYDVVATSISYALQAGTSIEGLETADQAGTAAINLTGNEIDNVLIGNAGANILDGGAGADEMQGLGGDDRYIVDNAGDRVYEIAGDGNDIVLASVSYTLQAGTSVETLQTNSHTGTAAINLTGNELANTVIGNAGANILDGGAGADKLQGLGGDDRYFVDNVGDRVYEGANAGYDVVLASVSYTLQAGSHVEELRTVDDAGMAAISLTGNELANSVYGNAGNNLLHGGAGNDVLIGLGGDDRLFGDAGNDTFVFGAGCGRDVVEGFAGNGSAAGDSIAFQGGVFSSFNDLMAHAAQKGTDVVFTLDASNSVTLHNVQLSALSAQDFTFA